MKFENEIFHLALKMLSSEFVLSNTMRLLETVSFGISESVIRLKESREHGDEEYIEAITDEECSAVEGLLGVAMVILQERIKSIIKGADRITSLAKKSSNKIRIPEGIGLMKFGCRKIGNRTSIYQIEAIDGAANYFKHHSEWSNKEWRHIRRLSPQRAHKEELSLQRKTLSIVMPLGMKQGSTGNLRIVARRIGGRKEPVDGLYKVVDDWRSYIEKEASRGLRNCKLIP